MRKPNAKLLPLYCGVIAASIGVSAYANEDDFLAEMSLEDIMNITVVSASKSEEKLSEAPATMVVINQKEIRQRGYKDITDIFDDLPGMHVSRSYGDTRLKNSWRGIRKTIGDTYLVMVDGIILNTLYFNDAAVFPTLPLSNVDHIEVLYGPASAVYGPNAFVGVINVITKKDSADDGGSVNGWISAGSNDTKIADLNYLYKQGDFRVSVTGRFINSVADDSAAESYEWTKEKYYADPALWGAFTENDNIAGSNHSPIKDKAIDVRAYLKNFEAGFQYYESNTGYGYHYPFDKVQNNGIWKQPNMSYHVRFDHGDDDKYSSTTLVRYRESDVSNDSIFLEGYGSTVDQEAFPGAENHVVDYSYWQSLNQSWSVFHDMEYRLTDTINLVAGIKFEQKDLQKAYDAIYSAGIPPSFITDLGSFPFPDPPQETNIQYNRITTEDTGVYALVKWQVVPEQHTVNLGLRRDENSEYGDALTIRGGYVGKFGPFIGKVLYGEAFQEPTPRTLYGGWAGSGSDPNLDPEEAQTLEASLSYSTKNMNILGSFYRIESENTIVTTANGAENKGEGAISGVDIHVNALIPTDMVRQLKVWGYVSWIDAEESVPTDVNGEEIFVDEPVGDLADFMLKLGATAQVTKDLSMTLRGRHIGARETVKTNPVGEVDSFTTADFTIYWTNVLAEGMGVSLSVNNLFDEEYFHPGLREADAGVDEGVWDNGTWNGSDGWYSSLLPQPGRTVLLSLEWEH